MNKNTWIGHLSLIGANLIYGVNYVISKGIMPDFFSPRAIIFIRVSGTMILFWLVSSFLPKEMPEKRDLLKLALCSFFGVALNQIMFFEGLNLTTPINSSIIMTINPILVLVFSYFLLKDKITLKKIAGIILGGSGTVLLILSQGSVSFDSDKFVGNLFIVVNSSSFALYLVLVKPLMMKYKPVTIMKWLFLFGFILVLPFTIFPFSNLNYNQIPGEAWLSITYIVIGATFTGYLLYNFALRKVSPVVTSIYLYLQPLIASLVAIIIGQDVLTLEAVISAILIFTGVFFVSSNKIKNPGVVK
ncbi:MAG: DMT family transporter [Marinilabiliales bacterium]